MTHGIKDLVLVILFVVMAASGGYIASEWKHYEQATVPSAVADTLRTPAKLDLVQGEPGELRGETSGRRVVWLSLDEELKLRPLDNKSVWVFASKPGDYRVIAWSSINNLPTLNALTTVHVTAEKDKKDTTQ